MTKRGHFLLVMHNVVRLMAGGGEELLETLSNHCVYLEY